MTLIWARFIRLIALGGISLCAISLQSCASYASKLDKGTVSAITTKTAGAILLSLETEKIPCDTATLSLQNVNTGHVFGAGFIVVSWDKKRNIKLLSVSPGSYRLTDGGCHSETPGGDFTYTKDTRFLGISKAYTPINVRPGLITYPGTFIIRGRKATGARYGLIDLRQFKAEGLAKKYPVFTNRFAPQIVQVLPTPDTGLRPRSGYINKA